jgi:hypothetical protein
MTVLPSADTAASLRCSIFEKSARSPAARASLADDPQHAFPGQGQMYRSSCCLPCGASETCGRCPTPSPGWLNAQKALADLHPTLPNKLLRSDPISNEKVVPGTRRHRPLKKEKPRRQKKRRRINWKSVPLTSLLTRQNESRQPSLPGARPGLIAPSYAPPTGWPRPPP